jgi:transposase InsO family protein
MPHANGKLGPAGRRKLVQLMIGEGMSERQAAACLSVSACTAHRWKTRWLTATPNERASGAWARDRSSRPHRSPRRTSATIEREVVAARRRTGWGPRLIAGETGVAHSTVHAILRRHGVSRMPKAPREAVVRFEWPCPGDLLQMDTKRFARFTRPGHRVTGERHRTGAEKRMKVGWEFCHSIIDDHSRIAYSELHPDEHAATVTAFVDRALVFYAALGIRPIRLQTDNAWTYTHNRSLAALLTSRAIRHRTIPPRTPKRNGKIERYQQTLGREWGFGQRYRSSTTRAAALPHWLDHYNRGRPHSEIGNRPPISRAPNLPGQDS